MEKRRIYNFTGPEDETEYVYSKMHYWMYKGFVLFNARRLAPRLTNLLEKLPNNCDALKSKCLIILEELDKFSHLKDGQKRLDRKIKEEMEKEAERKALEPIILQLKKSILEDELEFEEYDRLEKLKKKEELRRMMNLD